MKTPNCSLCTWNDKNELFCKAQGYNDQRDCYNSKECKKLYEVKEEKETKKEYIKREGKTNP